MKSTFVSMTKRKEGRSFQEQIFRLTKFIIKVKNTIDYSRDIKKRKDIIDYSRDMK